jgi:hypothetical protein
MLYCWYNPCMSTLLDRIKNRTLTDGSPPTSPPATDAIILETETALGFQLPPLLKQIYTQIGNGGFGAGYGIIGAIGGYKPGHWTLVESYNDVIAGAKYLGFEWQAGLLPFCEWGCSMVTCVDCIAEKGAIYQTEACKSRKMKYRFEDFFEMWLAGVSILDVDRLPRKTIEGINPFTKKKTTFVGRSQAPE